VNLHGRHIIGHFGGLIFGKPGEASVLLNLNTFSILFTYFFTASAHLLSHTVY